MLVMIPLNWLITRQIKRIKGQNLVQKDLRIRELSEACVHTRATRVTLHRSCQASRL